MPYPRLNSLALVLVLSPCLLLAGWEDIDVSRTAPRQKAPVVSAAPARPAPAPTYRAPAPAPAPAYRAPAPAPTPAYRAPAPAPAPAYRAPAPAPAPAYRAPAPAPVPAYQPTAAYGTGMPADPGQYLPPDLFSAHLDTTHESDSWYRARIALPASLDDESLGDGELSMLEIDAHFSLWTFRNFLGGDLAISLDPGATIFTDDADLDLMPSFLLSLPVDVDWTWRFVNGCSLEAGATPGIYTDIDALGGEMFYVPFRLCLYYAVDPTISLRGGAEIRPGWGETAMPLLGLAWKPNEQFLLEVGAPRTMASLQLGAVGLYGLVEWRNRSFNMGGDENEPDTITLNDWKIGGGLSIDFTETCRLTVEGGYLFERSLEVEGDVGEDELEVDPAPYLGILFGSEF